MSAPATQYGADRHSYAHRPRPCAHCHEVLPAEAFDMGPSGKRRRGICRDCTGREAAEREQQRAERRATWKDPESGQMVRRCSRCCLVHPLDDQHFAWADREHTELQWWCRACATAARAARHKERMGDPEYAARWREQQARQKRAWNGANRERVREIQRRNRERIKRDPVRLGRRQEADRLNYRMRAERRGRDVANMRRTPGASRTLEREQGGTLPAAPLAAAIGRRVERSEATTQEVCRDLGVNERTYTAWRSGERGQVQMDKADRIIQRMGVNWFDVFDGDVYPEAHARAAELFA